MPAGIDVTLPFPLSLPEEYTRSVYGAGAKLAVTVTLAFIVNWQVCVPLQTPPPHPANW
jgi:hypothetical protein